MEQYIAIILTSVITITTIIYTFYSVQLWRTSRQSAEISRQAALGNLWSELNRYIEICKQESRPETKVMQQLSGIIAEYILANLMNDINKRKDIYVTDFQRKIKELVDAENVDISTIAWLSPLLGKQK